MTASTSPTANGPTKRLAKRIVAPFERRIELAVSRAVEQAMRTEAVIIQDALRCDVATLVELTYELQRQIEGITPPATQPGHTNQP
jgi:hypothetical protein